MGIAEDDFNVAAINESNLRECVLQRLIDWTQCCSAVHKPPNPGQRFLRMRSKWPGSTRTSEKRNELAPPQVPSGKTRLVQRPKPSTLRPSSEREMAHILEADQANVRLGTEAGICRARSDVRFT